MNHQKKWHDGDDVVIDNLIYQDFDYSYVVPKRFQVIKDLLYNYSFQSREESITKFSVTCT